MSQTKVDVIIPTHNRFECLKRAVESVLNQTFTPFSLWIVDDHSTDGTKDWISDLISSSKNQEIHYLTTQEEQTSPSTKPASNPVSKPAGVSRARNVGILRSQAPLIAFLDSDDAWQPEKLRRQVEWMEENPRIALCHTEEIWIRNGHRVNPCKHHRKSGGRIFNECLARCVISPSAAMVRRWIFQRHQQECPTLLFDETLPACEDYDLWLRITARHSVGFLTEPLTVKYGGHPDQLSQKYPAMDRFRVQALEKIFIQNESIQALDTSEIDHLLKTLEQKSRILESGARKRGNQEWADHYAKKRAWVQTQLQRVP